MEVNDFLNTNYNNTLFRKDNNNNITLWYARPYKEGIELIHGRLDGNLIREYIKVNRNVENEIASRINAKRKIGYKYISDLKDNNELPCKGGIHQFLEAYLPSIRTTADGSTLPMLAKTFDNTNNKLFKKVSNYFGQYKINGLRCFIRAEKSSLLFNDYHLTFQSREGTYWNSLQVLEAKLLAIIPTDLLDLMVNDNFILDGELYLPGYSVNEINHFVKNTSAPQNALLQYWCYDLAIENTIQNTRLNILSSYFYNYKKCFLDKNEHLNYQNPFILLPSFYISSESDAISHRNEFISLGFEGLIMRNPNEEYQFGKRNSTMIKYKSSTDGKFKIIDIYPEGFKRTDVPLFKLQNDINNATFEVHINGSMDYQKQFLTPSIKQETIGKYMYVEFGERSGVQDLPFHVKTVRLI